MIWEVKELQHVNNILQKTYIHNILNDYSVPINLSPETSYLSLLKKGKPQLLGIFETLKKTCVIQMQLGKRLT